MGWPQITMIILFAISGTSYLIKHGKPQGDYNFFVWGISFIVEMTLLIKGGFFG